MMFICMLNHVEQSWVFLAAMCEATCTWSGQLPQKNYKNPTYSCKVFLGGVPWDITEGQASWGQGHKILKQTTCVISLW